MPNSQTYVAPWARVAILIGSLFALFGLSWNLTREMLPSKPQDALIFQSALLMIVLGSAVIESKFTKPADSLVNSLMGLLTLLPVAKVAPPLAWRLVFGYCCSVFILSAVCLSVSSRRGLTGWRATLARRTYKLSVFFGKGRLLYSIVFLFALLAFYGLQSTQTLALIVFWGLFLVIWPLGLPELLSAIIKPRMEAQPIGKVVRCKRRSESATLGVRYADGTNSITGIGTPASWANPSAAVGDILEANYPGEISKLAWIQRPRDAETYDNLIEATTRAVPTGV